MSNHQSYLDPVVIGLNLPRRLTFMARDSLFRYFLFGCLIRRLGAFPVKRDTADKAAIKHAIQLLRQGKVLCMFPEGTRSLDGKLGRLKSGFSIIARRARVPIMPVYVDGTFRAWPKGKTWPRPSHVSVRYGEVVSAEQVQSLNPGELESLVTHKIKSLEARASGED